ncbi:MAG: hypothetical protein CVU59_04360 [Deltaproteobacteria bacterium HGW-Deltaproteobacteria-17]|nr:MAG: hypothetical protein CVU59_04360 [Deltaproteobacteria bacterium HGW-Deltaproteobacteria-17]
MFLLMLVLSAGCRRSGSVEDLEPFAPVRPAVTNRTQKTADPEAPRPLAVTDEGSVGEPLVFVQDRGAWMLLDDQARRLFRVFAPVPEDDPQPARVAAAFFASRQRTVYVLYHQTLHAIPLARPALRTVASLGAGPLCAFPPPFEQHVLQDDDLGEDPDLKRLCVVLRDAPEPDTHRACSIAVSPEDGAVKAACTRDDGGQAGRPVEPASCTIQPPLRHPPAASGWTPDEAACAIRQDRSGRIIPLHPDADEPSECQVRFEGMSADGRFAIWCTSDPEPEYAGQKCRIVDLQRLLSLEPGFDLPLEAHVRWDGTARAALAGDFLILMHRSPVRYVELNATALFVR